MTLLETYRRVHAQAYMPIFVKDDLDSKMLVEACVEAGFRTIEYTLRRDDVGDMIPWIKKNYPELTILVGSTIDNDRIVKQKRRKFPHLLTVAELADLGIDGFVSMLPWQEKTIEKYCPTHLIAPSAMTVSEAYLQVCAGAQFVKFNGAHLDVVHRSRHLPTFAYCPILVTGGVTLENMANVFQTGAVMVAAGFDALVKNIAGPPTRVDLVGILRTYQQQASAIQSETYPELGAAKDADDNAWLDALPHVHPFD